MVVLEKESSLEKYSKPKYILSLVAVVLMLSFFVGNFLLHFLQEIFYYVMPMVSPEKFEAKEFVINWKMMFVFQKEVKEFYLLFYAFIAFQLAKFYYNVKMNYESLNRGQHGTSEFETVSNLKKQYKVIPASKKEYEGVGGVIVGGLRETGRPYRLLIDESPVHTMVIGITRSGKGETFVFPMIDALSRASNKPSLLINDPKGELAGASYNTLVERGYEVHVFNLIQTHMGMGFNPLQLVIDAWKEGNISLAQQYANSITFSLYHNPQATEPMWDESAASLVTAIILGLTEDAVKLGKEEKVNMYSVASFLSTKGSDTDEKTDKNALDEYFKAREELNPAKLAYSTSNFAGGNTRASIFTTAMSKLQIFMLEPNAKLTSYNSLKLTDIGFGEKPVALFMVTPDYDSSNHVLASILVGQLYRVNAEKSTMSEGGRMKRDVHCILDEFGNMPTIEGMAGMVTVGAGRGFRFHLIVQAYSQVKSQYGEESETIVGNCSNQIYILTLDKSTAEHYSGLIGSKTITDVSRSGKILSSDKQHSEAVKERPLLMPDELMQLKEEESVVVRANKRQDLKRRKIVPKPIFNTGATAHKFRYEYLADDFDNSNSILELPLMSMEYHDIDLSKIVFTSKGDEDFYIPIIELMDKESFTEFKKKVVRMVNVRDTDGVIYEQLNHWSYLHLFSYFVHELEGYSKENEKMMEQARNHVPDAFVDAWLNLLKEKPRKEGRRVSQGNPYPSMKKMDLEE